MGIVEDLVKHQHERAINNAGHICQWCGARGRVKFNSKEMIVECVDELSCIMRCRHTPNYRTHKPQVHHYG